MSTISYKLKAPKNPVLGGIVEIAIAPTCCGASMKETSSYDGSFGNSYRTFDCPHCGAMLNLEIKIEESPNCTRCGGGRCKRDHLGDDGGYLL